MDYNTQSAITKSRKQQLKEDKNCENVQQAKKPKMYTLNSSIYLQLKWNEKENWWQKVFFLSLRLVY